MTEKQNEESKEKKEEMKEKEEKSARDKVSLKHISVKKQEPSPEAIKLATTLKTQIFTHDSFETLTNNEKTMLECFMNRRLFLSRIAIIMNQTRIPLGLPPLKKAELEAILSNLIAKGYVATEIVGENRVYYLTERGRSRVQ
ncbi:MAG: hypothetical protein ACTSUN_10455 [Promethearchaeota archaeon]